jgi:2-hydroxychromene-2-carboxylate isomerase
MLWARGEGAELFDRFIDEAYARFWRRELDIEEHGVLASLLGEVGADVSGFREFAEGPGRAEHDELNERAFAAGVYGVPTYLVGEEMWFGREHLPRVAWLLGGAAGPAPDVANRSFGP